MFSKYKSPFGKGKPVAKPAVKTNTSAKKIAARKAPAPAQKDSQVQFDASPPKWTGGGGIVSEE